MKIKPFGERVTIKLVQEDQYTESGLLVATKTASNKGIIEDVLYSGIWAVLERKIKNGSV